MLTFNKVTCMILKDLLDLHQHKQENMQENSVFGKAAIKSLKNKS